MNRFILSLMASIFVASVNASASCPAPDTQKNAAVEAITDKGGNPSTLDAVT